jgi:hypothetical protein
MWVAALNSRSVDQVAGLFETGGTFEEPMTGGALSGAALRAFFSRMWRDWPNLVFTTKTAIAENHRLVLEWRSQGTNVRRRAVTVNGATVIDWAGDHITRARVYYDPLVYMQLLAPPA